MYNPADDSTTAYMRQANDSGRLWIDISDSACLCGCTEPTQGKFRPGHDARLKGRLLRAHLNKVGLTLIKDGKERQLTARAYAKEVSSEKHDWTVALDAAHERARVAAQALKEKVQAKTAKQKAEAEEEAKEETLEEEGAAAAS